MVQQGDKIILASASPRRREILENAGFSFAVCPVDVDETMEPSDCPKMAVQLLAAKKAAAAASKQNGLVIGADTIVVDGNEILGKPQSEADAFRMLRQLSGKTHAVMTGIAVVRAADGYMRTHCEETYVTFRALSDAEISDYIKTGEPMDKAGAYGIQGKGGALVEAVSGDIQNVIGLPLSALRRLLE